MTNYKNNQPDNTGNNTPQRDKQGKFVKGYSGNPKGKPRGSLSITARIKEELRKVPKGQKISYLEALIKIILRKALLEGDKDMIKTIWQAVDGMPKQHIDTTDEDIREIKVVIVENEDKSDITDQQGNKQKVP